MIARFKEARRGFTLVELLVVIAIIGVLVALLLPAVQSARDAARRTQCTNNVKNLTLGEINHLDAIGHFPTGGWGYTWVGDPDRGFDERQPGGVFYNLLPFIEMSALHDMGLGMGDGTTSNEKGLLALKMIQTPVPILTCPTRRPSKSFGIRVSRLPMRNAAAPGAGRGGVDNGYGWFKACYASNGGSRGVGLGDGPKDHKEGDAISAQRGLYVSDGDSIGHDRSGVTQRHIVDGMSNTYMIGEKNIGILDYYSETGNDFGDDEPALGADDMDQWKVGSCTMPPSQDAEIGTGVGWGGPHPAVFTMGFCDGSVHQISYDIDPAVHAANASRNDEGGINCAPVIPVEKPTRG